MLGKIISQLYRIADLLKDKKLVDKDSNTDSNSSENKPKEITLDDIYQYYKSQLEVEFSNDIQHGVIQPFPQTFDDIESSNSETVNETGIYKCNGVYGTVLFSYIITGPVNIRNYVCFILDNK